MSQRLFLTLSNRVQLKGRARTAVQVSYYAILREDFIKPMIGQVEW